MKARRSARDEPNGNGDGDVRDGSFSYGVARGATAQATTHIECCRCLRVIEPALYRAAMALLRPLVATLARRAR